MIHVTEESANQLLRIPVRIFPYGPPHTDCLIRTDFHHNKITRVYGPNVFIENKAVKKGIKCNLMKPELARAVLKDQGPVFLSMARANPVNKPFII